MNDTLDKIVSIIAGSMLLAFLSGFVWHFTGGNAFQRPKGKEVPGPVRIFFSVLLVVCWFVSVGGWIWHIVLAKSWISAIITFFILVCSNSAGWMLGRKWYENPK